MISRTAESGSAFLFFRSFDKKSLALCGIETYVSIFNSKIKDLMKNLCHLLYRRESHLRFILIKLLDRICLDVFQSQSPECRKNVIVNQVAVGLQRCVPQLRRFCFLCSRGQPQSPQNFRSRYWIKVSGRGMSFRLHCGLHVPDKLINQCFCLLWRRKPISS